MDIEDDDSPKRKKKLIESDSEVEVVNVKKNRKRG
jgi:hypothetical protein